MEKWLPENGIRFTINMPALAGEERKTSNNQSVAKRWRKHFFQN